MGPPHHVDPSRFILPTVSLVGESPVCIQMKATMYHSNININNKGLYVINRTSPVTVTSINGFIVDLSLLSIGSIDGPPCLGPAATSVG